MNHAWAYEEEQIIPERVTSGSDELFQKFIWDISATKTTETKIPW